MVGANLFRIKRSYSLYVRYKKDIGRYLLGIAESFPGFNMVMVFDFLHIAGILFRVKQLLSIASSH